MLGGCEIGLVVVGGLVVLTTGLALTVKEPFEAVLIGTPVAEVAPDPMVITTFAPYGRAAAGVKTSTWFVSAQVTLPATVLPAAVTLRAAAVAARFILAVKRTERTTVRS